MINTTHLIYFSPTGTTGKIVKEVATGIGSRDVGDYNLTVMSQDIPLSFNDGLAVFGVPVYAGRVPEIFLKRIENISGNGIPAVLIVLYGNRAYEDALVELRDVITTKRFNVIAAGAFIGEHSFSTEDRPVAVNRPDAEDLKYAREFGVSISGKLKGQTVLTNPGIPGNTPYKERILPVGISPETNSELCTLCSACVSVCPVSIISVNKEVATIAENCIMCCACVRFCRNKARVLVHPTVETRRDMLVKNCSERKVPACFL